jgi:hypothetical protein
MFNLKIDEKTETYHLAEESTFGEVMSKLSDRMNREGRVITNIEMNHQQLVGGRQFAFRNYPLERIETLRLTTANPKTLAQEALDSSQEQVKNLQQIAFRTGELFRLGDDLEANDSYSRLIEGLRWLVRGVDAMTGMMKIDRTIPLLEGKSADYYQRVLLIPILDSMFEAQKKEDWIALADALEYEFVPALKEWEQLLGALRDRITSN